MNRRILLLLPIVFFGLSLQAQYLETFNGQNGKGLVDAICPTGTTNINNCGSACTANNLDNTSTCSQVPVDLSGVSWTLVAPGGYFTDPSGFGFDDTSPDDFGVVSDRMQINDPDNEICWLSPVLNISGAGAVSVSIGSVSQTGLESDDYINASYRLNGGAWVQFGTANGNFAATSFNAAGLSGTTLQIRVCSKVNGSSDFIYFDNVSVPQSGVTVGCPAPAVGTVVSPAGSCNPASGAITVTATGGTPGYQVAWSGPSSGNPAGVEIASSGGMYTITGLTAGNYTITVTDASSCSATATATVGIAPAMSLGTQVLNASCANDQNGAIDLTVSNGSAPYSYSWSFLPGSPDPEDVPGLAPGTYTVTVTDQAGCTATTSATVGSATAGLYQETFSIPNKGYQLNNLNNFFGVNWTMSAWGGGRDAFDYFNTTGAGLLEGIDLDEEVCWLSPILDISVASPASITSKVTWTNFDASAGGGDPGDYIHMQYSVNGGAFVTYASVNYGSGTNQSNPIHPITLSYGLPFGAWVSGNTLQVRICSRTNGNDELVGIDEVSVFNVNGPANVSLACVTPEVTVASVTNTKCFNGSDGAIDINVTDGTPPYTYSWSNLPGAPDPEDQTGLSAGTYTVTVTDSDGVTATTSATVSQPPILFASTVVTSACGGNDGAIDLSVSGGTPGYTYGWSNGPTTQDLSGLSVGSYTVTVTDVNGCALTTSATVTTAGCCMVTANAGPNRTICPGAYTVIGGTPTGSGTPTLSYAWSPAVGLNSTTLANPTASVGGTPRTYTVTVTSSAGCTATSSVTVSAHPFVSAAAVPTSPLCYGDPGKLTINVSSGAFPYDLNWGSGSTDNKPSGYMIQNLPAGAFYVVTVTDNNGCTDTAAAYISQPPLLSIADSVGNIQCAGGSNGSIKVYMFGGVPLYGISWEGPRDSMVSGKSSPYIISGLPAGDYSITVTDQNGCTKTTTATVNTQNPLPDCTISDPMSVVCPFSTGNQYSGPPGMDQYAWGVLDSGKIVGPTNAQSILVTAGSFSTYTVMLTVVKNGCSASCSKEVEIATIPFHITFNSEYCQGDPGPVIGLDGSEVGAMYQLQDAGGNNLGAPVAGNGTAIAFGSYPNGSYKVVITGGTCDATLSASVSGSPVNCRIDVPDVCNCNDPSGHTPATVKVIAPAFQNWTVVDVIGLYGPVNPYPPITVGTPLTYIGGNMYTLNATRDNTKGYYVKVSNGFVEKEIQVGNPSW